MQDIIVENVATVVEELNQSIQLLQSERVEEAVETLKECEKKIETVLVQLAEKCVVLEALDILEHASDLKEAKAIVARLAASREVCKGVIID